MMRNRNFYFEETHNWMTGKGLTNLKGALESEFFLLNYRKTRILNDVTNGPKKEYAKNFFIFQ